ncbi:MAG TPA: PEP-CTERM sorting domain-containing protein [Candidatus Paceibacterota bacterium]|nr:PEP-CTERM sorting domain-containing protein [Candidatus Paceibacterota bacterium]
MAGLPIVLSTLPLISGAAPATLANGNSSLSADPGTDHILGSWLIDGKNQLSIQSLWYRVGSVGGESAISTIPIVNQVQATSSSLYVKYSNGQFSIETTYSLVGGAPGSGDSNLGTQVKITNLGTTALDFHLFQYSDFDLTGASAGDTVLLGQNLQGGFNEALQTKASGVFADTVFTTGANHGQAGLFPAILNSLNDGNPTTLNNNAGPVTGDGTWAVQWDRTIAAGGTLLVGMNNNISIVPVPEPSTLAMFPLGVAVFMAYRRFRSN